jgi:hypothetical protein
LDADKEKPVTAGGVILYRFQKKNMELLLVEGRGVFEDLGGVADEADRDIHSTVSREAWEESNELLSKITIKKRIKESSYVYMPRCKYVVYVIPATKSEEKLTSTDFGDKEEHDNFYRKIKWIPVDTFLSKDIIDHKLNFRLKNGALFNKIKEIKNDKKLDHNMLSDTSKSTESSNEELESESEEEKVVKKPNTKKGAMKKPIKKKASKKQVSSDEEDESESESEPESEPEPEPEKKSTKKKASKKQVSSDEEDETESESEKKPTKKRSVKTK